MNTLMHQSLKNELFGVKIESDDEYYDAFILTHISDDYPFCTLYCDPQGTFSVYLVINDIDAGVSIDDEKVIDLKLTSRQTISAIKRLQTRIYGNYEDYKHQSHPTAPDIAD